VRSGVAIALAFLIVFLVALCVGYAEFIRGPQ